MPEPTEELSERTVVAVLTDATQEQLTTADSFWRWLAGRSLTSVAYQWPDDLAVEITGYFPEGVVAGISFLTFNEWELYDENALFDVSVSFYDRDGKLYVPTGALQVALKGSLVSNAIIANQSLFVYARTENAEREEAIYKRSNDRRYAADVWVYRDYAADSSRFLYKEYRLDDDMVFFDQHGGLNINGDHTAFFRTDAPNGKLEFFVSTQLSEAQIQARADALASTEEPVTTDEPTVTADPAETTEPTQIEGNVAASHDAVSVTGDIPEGTLAERIDGSENYAGIDPASLGAPLLGAENHVLTITADSASREYDGTELTADTYTVDGLVEGDTLQGVTVTGSQTDVGESANTVSGTVVIMRDGVDVTDSYIINEFVNGKLTVTPAAVTVAADAVSKVYG